MTKRIKVQIMLPEDIVEKIEYECKENFMKKSSWFEKITHTYFHEKESKISKRKKINLDI